MNPKMHYLYARALARTGKQISAIYELNSAILARPSAKGRQLIYKKMAEGYRRLGYAKYARRAAELADLAKAEQQKEKNADFESRGSKKGATIAVPLPRNLRPRSGDLR